MKKIYSSSGSRRFRLSPFRFSANLLLRVTQFAIPSPVPLLFGFLLLPMTSTAAPGAWMPQARTIEEIIIEGDASGSALVVISGGVPEDFIPPACNSIYNTLDLGTSKGRGQLAVALSAYMAGKPVKLALSCVGNRPLVTHIRF